jgi:hypothetical protein
MIAKFPLASQPLALRSLSNVEISFVFVLWGDKEKISMHDVTKKAEDEDLRVVENRKRY